MEKSRAKRVKDWHFRWADFVGWLPLQTALAIIGVVVLGGMAQGLGPDLLSWLAEVPIYLAFAFAALGVSYAAWRKWRLPLDEQQKAEFWRGLMAGDRGALTVFVVNALFYLGVLWLAFSFFKPSR